MCVNTWKWEATLVSAPRRAVSHVSKARVLFDIDEALENTCLFMYKCHRVVTFLAKGIDGSFKGTRECWRAKTFTQRAIKALELQAFARMPKIIYELECILLLIKYNLSIMSQKKLNSIIQLVILKMWYFTYLTIQKSYPLHHMDQ